MEHYTVGCNACYLESSFALHPEDEDAVMPDKCEGCGSRDIDVKQE